MTKDGCISSKNLEEKNNKKSSEKILEHEGNLYAKSTETKRKLDLGFKFSKLPSGLEFKTISGLEVDKKRNYEKINKEEKNYNKLPEEEKKTNK